MLMGKLFSTKKLFHTAATPPRRTASCSAPSPPSPPPITSPSPSSDPSSSSTTSSSSTSSTTSSPVSRTPPSPILLTYNSCCDLYQGVVSRCRVVHGRYLATPWLSSPHIQTVFLNFCGNPPNVSYRRQIFHASDGGTIALDWVNTLDVSGGSSSMDESFCRDDGTPIAVVVPGLTSDSFSPYLKHLAFHTARSGWNVVVSNHRGLGGVSVTSDCFYNAGWTEDLRDVLNFLNQQYPKAPLFAIGTSIGANILVKYLGEDGENVPLAGAAAVCNPWDLLIGDRFINRKLVQKLYDRALTIGLQGYAQLHEPQYTRLADWEGIKKSRCFYDILSGPRAFSAIFSRKMCIAPMREP
ncbi:hypothetical protein MLD38_015887 [Melastoma candidum]|uniref:Uncharacterized protein n=1 Tax=Melastoma candidum TaxID=119954 RepID=A0ACB9RHD7_9MYRT|nr:hypothetical protein MLD38_015887 [Melastoma candidum]